MEKIKSVFDLKFDTDVVPAVGIIVVLFLLGRLIKFLFCKVADQRAAKEKHLSATTITVVGKSLAFITVITGFLIATKIIDFDPKHDSFIHDIRNILYTLIVGYVSFQFVEIPSAWFRVNVAKDNAKQNKMFLPVLRKTLQVGVIVLTVLQTAQILSDKPVTSIIAGLGIGGLALALAAQDTLKHFFGSFVLAGDKPFEIGDRIVIDGHDGPVESIGLRSTRIRTLEGHVVTIPNGELANKTIQNVGKRESIRRVLNIGLTYNTAPYKVKEAIAIVKEILAEHDGMDPEFPPQVFFNDFKADSLNIFVIYWFHPPAYWDFLALNEKVNLQILERFNKAGIEFAFPTQTVHLVNEG